MDQPLLIINYSLPRPLIFKRHRAYIEPSRLAPRCCGKIYSIALLIPMHTLNPARAQRALRISPVLAQIIAALFIGGVLLYTAGFAQVGHDAAHDTRHSVNFPCH